MSYYKEIKLSDLNRHEALRYMGYHDAEQDERLTHLIDIYEKEVLNCAIPRYVYRIFDIEQIKDGIHLVNEDMILRGESIKNHLKNCKRAVLFAVTVSENIDRLIRQAHVQDMTKELIVDALSSVAVEQACDKFEKILKEKTEEKYQTFRFGVGYGDFPLAQQKDFIKLLNASKIIGLNVSPSYMLTPVKSVTAVIGLSDEPIELQKRGCLVCNLKETCQLRKKGGHCNGK